MADFRDPVTGNPFRWGPLVEFLDSLVGPRLLRHAAAAIANTDMAADLLTRTYPQWAGKISLLWNGYDPEAILTPIPIPGREHKVMRHVGNFYLGRHSLRLLQSVDRLASGDSWTVPSFTSNLQDT